MEYSLRGQGGRYANTITQVEEPSEVKGDDRGTGLKFELMEFVRPGESGEADETWNTLLQLAAMYSY